MFIIDSDFIGDFKLGDNINYNLKILKLLYRNFGSANQEEKKLLSKPITILLISIIEASLHDFHKRITGFTVEGVQNLASNVIAYIRQKEIDEFKKYIDSARKHDLLDSKNPDFYKKLDFLRKIRNRIHIQNAQHELESNDSEVFTEERKILAEEICEQTLKILTTKYPRPERMRGHVNNFELPWDEHISYEDESSMSYLDYIQEYYGMSLEQLQLLGYL